MQTWIKSYHSRFNGSLAQNALADVDQIRKNLGTQVNKLKRPCKYGSNGRLMKKAMVGRASTYILLREDKTPLQIWIKWDKMSPRFLSQNSHADRIKLFNLSGCHKMGFPIDLPSSPEEEETNLSIIISLRDLRLIKYLVRAPFSVQMD